MNETIVQDSNNVSPHSTGAMDYAGAIMPVAIFFVIFYFLLIRPQKRKEEQHREEIKNLKINDKVLTSSGVYGIVTKIKEQTILVKIADNVEIEVVPETLNLIKDKK